MISGGNNIEAFFSGKLILDCNLIAGSSFSAYNPNISYNWAIRDISIRQMPIYNRPCTDAGRGRAEPGGDLVELASPIGAGVQR